MRRPALPSWVALSSLMTLKRIPPAVGPAEASGTAEAGGSAEPGATAEWTMPCGAVSGAPEVDVGATITNGVMVPEWAREVLVLE